MPDDRVNRVKGEALADDAAAGDRADAIVRRLELAHYVRQMTQELLAMAKGARFETIAHLLDMARLQAQHDIDSLKNKVDSPARD